MLEAAADEELATRAMPSFNAAPSTAWREPPALPEGAPPVVRYIEDVVPVARLKEVLWWTRRLDRCLRAAEAGNMQLARRLRPPDVCMDEAHMVEGTEKWVWDLRPLQEGLPATPLSPSGRGMPPETDLDLEAVRAAGVGFADQGIVSELIHGVSDDNPMGGATVLSPPHEGALRYYAHVLSKLKKDEGHAAGRVADGTCRSGRCGRTRIQSWRSYAARSQSTAWSLTCRGRDGKGEWDERCR